jgi:peptide/nickel transport system ATP-binding protein
MFVGLARLSRMKSREIIFSEIAPKVKLSPEVLNRYPIELSGGMKQRLVMVLSTLLNPSLLIADEITSALDMASQKAVAEMQVEFRNQQCCNSTLMASIPRLTANGRPATRH